jgi:glucose-6-phosphate isomerase
VVPEGVGGRFSVLSPVGLLPAAIVGIDVAALLAGAAEMDRRCEGATLEENPALLAAACQVALYNKGKRIHVMMPYSSQLRDVADWFRQLWAESLGKLTDGAKPADGGVGPTPARCVGTTDQHSQIQLYREGPNDKVITFIRVEHFPEAVTIPPAFEEYPGLGYLGDHTLAEVLNAEQTATAYALAASSRPTVTIHLPAVTAHAVGQLLHLLMVQTSFAGLMLGINAYDQPAVELGKQATFALLGRKGHEKLAGEIRTFAGGKGRAV